MSNVTTFRRAMSGYDFDHKDTYHSIIRKLEDAGFEDIDINVRPVVRDTHVLFESSISLVITDEMNKVDTKKTKKKTEPVVSIEATDDDRVMLDDIRRNNYYINGFAILHIGTEKVVEVGTINSLLNALHNAGVEVKYVEAPAVNPAFATTIPAVTTTPPVAAPTEVNTTPCAECSNPITPYTSKAGKYMSVKMQVDMTNRNYQKPLCKACNAKHWSASKG